MLFIFNKLFIVLKMSENVWILFELRLVVKGKNKNLPPTPSTPIIGREMVVQKL